MSAQVTMPSDWHRDPSDGFHGQISKKGPFRPEKGRYHLYIGLFCPFAHRANLAMDLKQIKEYADIGTSIVRPFSLGSGENTLGLRFNVAEDAPGHHENYPGATRDQLFDSVTLRDVYIRADASFDGRASVPMLWDCKLGTVVNNESADLLRQLQTAFDPVLPEHLQAVNLYPLSRQIEIDMIAEWINQDLNLGVYKVGFAVDQKSYDDRVLLLFEGLKRAADLITCHGGPFVLGEDLTILDVQLFATIVRFDPAYVQAFSCNLGDIRRDHPILNRWMKGLFYNATGKTTPFQQTTSFEHIKDFYFKNFPELNPRRITPRGPCPSIEDYSLEDVV